jgi:hypothetical protein
MDRTFQGLAEWAKEPVSKLTAELAAGLGERLVAVVVSGDATEEEPNGVLSLLVVTTRVDGGVLESVGAALSKARAGRVEPPLVMTEDEIRRSLDSWPVEFLSISARGKVVTGSLDLASMPEDEAGLRLQCERELRGLVIHCRFAYLASRKDETRLGEMVAGGATKLVVLARATLKVAGQAAEGSSAEVLKRLGTWLSTVKSGRGDSGSAELLADAWAQRNQKRPRWSGERLLALADLLERWVDAVDRLDGTAGERSGAGNPGWGN